MCKLFSRLFLALLAAFFVCALYLAALPSRLTADEIDGWQLRLLAPNGDVQALPLPTDYIQDDVSYTLSEPLIPLRTLAEACGITADYRQTDRYCGVLWAAADNAWLFTADQPIALQLYKEESDQICARAVQQFEHPRILWQQFCVPLSFLDILGLEYEINASSLQITVHTSPATPTAPAALWQAAEAELNRLYTPHRHILAEARAEASDLEIETAQSLLIAAATLHGQVIPPNGTFPLAPNNAQAAQALKSAAQKAKLPQTAEGLWLNDSIFPLQIACQAGARHLTIRLYQLNSMAVADDYLGQIAE